MSWLSDSMPDNMVVIEGYNLVRLDRGWKEDNRKNTKKGGGVGTYVREGLTYSQSRLQQYNISNKDLECCWVQLNRSEATDILVCALYKPPAGNVKNVYDMLISTLDEIGKNFKKEIFVLGDFNVNYINKDDINTKRLLQFETIVCLKLQYRDFSEQHQKCFMGQLLAL